MKVTKISSKGQVVLPRETREVLKLKEGTILAVIRKDDIIALKKIENPLLAQDIETLKRIEEAWEDVEKGRFKRMKSKDFLREIRTW